MIRDVKKQMFVKITSYVVFTLSGYMPQIMANAMPASVPVMHGGSRNNVYKYPPMTMHNTVHQQHVYQQPVQQQLPPAPVPTQPVLANK